MSSYAEAKKFIEDYAAKYPKATLDELTRALRDNSLPANKLFILETKKELDMQEETIVRVNVVESPNQTHVPGCGYARADTKIRRARLDSLLQEDCSKPTEYYVNRIVREFGVGLSHSLIKQVINEVREKNGLKLLASKEVKEKSVIDQEIRRIAIDLQNLMNKHQINFVSLTATPEDVQWHHESKINSYGKL